MLSLTFLHKQILYSLAFKARIPSQPTIRTYIARVGVNTTYEATKYAIRAGLVNIDEYV